MTRLLLPKGSIRKLHFIENYRYNCYFLYKQKHKQNNKLQNYKLLVLRNFLFESSHRGD